MKILLISHGKMALGIKDSVGYLIGNVSNIQANEFNNLMSVDDLADIFNEFIVEDDDCLIFTDLKGGSPFNVASMIAHTKPNVKIFYGMNLPTVLEAALLPNDTSLSSAVEILSNTSQESIGFLEIKEEI